MERKGLIDPDYARILIAPRATIRKVVDRDPRDRVIALIMVSGFAGALAAAIEFQPPQALKIGAHLIPEISAAVMWKIRLGQVVTSPLIAVAFLYLDGALLRWSGRLLGGAAQAVEVRAALGWSSIPSAGIAVIFILLTLLHPAPA